MKHVSTSLIEWTAFGGPSKHAGNYSKVQEWVMHSGSPHLNVRFFSCLSKLPKVNLSSTCQGSLNGVFHGMLTNWWSVSCRTERYLKSFFYRMFQILTDIFRYFIIIFLFSLFGCHIQSMLIDWLTSTRSGNNSVMGEMSEQSETGGSNWICTSILCAFRSESEVTYWRQNIVDLYRPPRCQSLASRLPVGNRPTTITWYLTQTGWN